MHMSTLNDFLYNFLWENNSTLELDFNSGLIQAAGIKGLTF